ncbi:MAG: hypothetical protein V7K64_22340 [Nostoc sp.]
MPNSLPNLAFTFAARAVGKWYGIALTYDVVYLHIQRIFADHWSANR